MNFFEQLLQTVLVLFVVLLNLYLNLLASTSLCTRHRYPLHIHLPFPNRNLNRCILFYHFLSCLFVLGNIFTLILLLSRSGSGGSFPLDDDGLLNGEFLFSGGLWFGLDEGDLLMWAGMMMFVYFGLRGTVEFIFHFDEFLLERHFFIVI